VSRVSARTVNALLAVAACVTGLAALYLAAFVVPVTEHADQRVFNAFLSLQTYRTATLAGYVTGFFDLGPYALAVLALTVAALALGERRKAVAVVAICAGANVTTQLLKVATAAPREPLWLAPASWPSGHLTAATSLALCLVLVAPPLLRTYAAGRGIRGHSRPGAQPSRCAQRAAARGRGAGRTQARRATGAEMRMPCLFPPSSIIA